MTTMLEDLAEVVRPRNEASDDNAEAPYKALRFIRTHGATIAQNAEEVDKLRSLCAAVYQAAGAYDMPERFLDAISDAANGHIEARRKTDELLPCDEPQNAEDAKRLKALEQAMEEAKCDPQVFVWICKRADEIVQGDSNDLIRN